MSILFLSPLDGDVFTNKAGLLRSDRTLLLTVRLAAPRGSEITVNGVSATDRGECFEACVVIDRSTQMLTARDGKSGACAEITVHWAPNATDAYRLSVDDNIWWLQDIAKHQDTYRSIFESPFLAFCREMHERYGTKVHLNLFYSTPEFGGFDLSEMPDRYRGEWGENADWLHLSFHAKAELPDRPYIDTDYHRIKRDLEQVEHEIRRFAGDCVLYPETTVHWGECTKEGVDALRDAGLKILLGYVSFDKKGKKWVSYHLTDEQVRQAQRYGAIYDRATRMPFVKTDVVLNSEAPEAIREILEREYQKYPEKGFWEFLVHEQYFYPFYRNYLPDYRERVLAALEWASEKKLAPRFLTDAFLTPFSG
ncbi:MAG: hypothetical protein E7663_07660 [Ruminococcaceae bacterium]|nr:hypothetical protein [Oscillospiraceae bacterium]